VAAISAKYRFRQVEDSDAATRVGITLRPHRLLVEPVEW
jgi:epi-isozizaene 5-monooxygenase / beta-farnesene synthase